MNDLRRFHNTLFVGMNASEEWFSWYFGEFNQLIRPASLPIRVYGMYDNGTLVGTWCVEPRSFIIRGKKTTVGRCFAVGIHPAYRRRNLFVELSQYAINHERLLAQYEYILGFPQVGRPVIAAHLKSGWTKTQDIEVKGCCPVAISKIEMNGISSIKLAKQFSVDGLTCDGFVNDGLYMQKRWLSHPDNQYTCLRTNDNNGYVVLKQYKKICHVLEINGTTDAVNHLLDVTKQLGYIHSWSEINIWCAHNEKLRAAISDSGFVSGAVHASSVVLLSVPITAKEELKLEEAHFGMGSEESF